MRNIAGIIPKWKDICIADIVPNGSYLRSNADIPKLSAIRLRMNIFQIKLRDEYDRSSVQPI